MANGKSDVMDAAHQVIVLAFDLVDAEVSDLPGQALKALQSPPVQDAIKKTLLDFAKSKAKTGTTVVTDAEAKKLLDSLGTGVKDAASKDVIDQIKKSPEYKKLEASLNGFQKAAASSALGVWIDRNKKILYVVGAALVVGTGAVLYLTKTGGKVLNKVIDPLKGSEIEVLQIGKLKFKVGLWDFQPDARILGARVFSTAQWEKVTLELKLGLLAQGTQVQEVQGAAVVKSGPFNVTVTGDDKPQSHQVNLGLKFGYDGRIGNGKFDLSVGAMYERQNQNQQVSATLEASLKTKNATFGLQGNVGPQKGGGVQYGGLFTVTIPLD